jgi:hypothetical protein
MFPYELEVELCQAHHCVPNPVMLLPVAVLITYWTWAFDAAVVLPKCAAAATASAASCDWVGWDGAALALSNQICVDALKTPVGFVACVPLEPQLVVPLATPSQYCVTELFQLLPPTFEKKLCWMDASPEGSFVPFVPHWLPQ